MVDGQEQELLALAQTARERAYVPYSHFSVGAALRSSSGRVFLGCNVENSAYPATICAERGAIAAAVAAGERDFVGLAVVANTPGPVAPCGMCRQVIAELAPRATVLLSNLEGAVERTTPQALLPGAFSARDLRHDQ